MSLTPELKSFIDARREAEARYIVREESKLIETLLQEQTMAGPPPRLIQLTAPAGMGKTELLLHLKYESSLRPEGKEHTLFPVYIDLIEYHGTPSLRDWLDLRFAEVQPPRPPHSSTLLLIDSLDVLNRIELLDSLLSFLPSVLSVASSIILSLRPSMGLDRHLFRSLDIHHDSRIRTVQTTVVRLHPFTDQEVDDFVRRHEDHPRTDLLRTFRSMRPTAALIQNPLMLRSMIEYWKSVDTSRSVVDPTAFFDIGLLLFLQRFEISHGVNVSFIQDLLSSMAGSMLHEGVKTISSIGFERLAQDLCESHSVPGHESSQLISILKGCSILESTGYQEFGFSHVAIFEVFLTRYLRMQAKAAEVRNTAEMERSIVIAIRVDMRDLVHRDSIGKILSILRSSIGVPEGALIPLYARSNSLDLVLLIAGVVVGRAFSEFFKAYFSKLGEVAAEQTLKTTLPKWLTKQPNATKLFLAAVKNRAMMNRDMAITEEDALRMAITAVWKEKFGQCIADESAERLLSSEDEKLDSGDTETSTDRPNRE